MRPAGGGAGAGGVAWWLLVLASLALVHLAVTTACDKDHQCEDNYYCSLYNQCVACHNCSEYNRLSVRECARSVLECGGCYEGYMETMFDTFAGKCLPGNAGGGAPDPKERAMPYYIWVPMLIGAIIVLVVLLVICVPRIRRAHVDHSGNTLDYSAPTDKDDPPASSTLINESRASAPTPPPPYNLEAPNGMEPYFGYIPDNQNNNSVSVKPHEAARLARGREDERSQEARMYSYPSYITPPAPPALHTPPAGPEEMLVDEQPAQPALRADDLPMDEDTMESTWTPAPENALTSFQLPPVMEEPSEASPSSRLCLRGNDRLANMDGGVVASHGRDPPSGTSTDEDDPTTTQGARTGPSTTAYADQPRPANVTNININFHQLNDLKLVRL